MPPPPKKNKGFFKLKKNLIASLATRILWTYAVKKCVFQYHEYGRRPGESIGILGCNAPPPHKKKQNNYFYFLKTCIHVIHLHHAPLCIQNWLAVSSTHSFFVVIVID